MMHDHANSDMPLQDKTVVQLIVFCAGGEEFGVKIDAVREIIKLGIVTPIPESPDFIKGIINVRGEIVTAIDVKSKFFNQPHNEIESKHVVVTKKDENLFGLIVDEVIEVLRILNKDIKSTPPLFDKINEKYVSGIISHEGRLIILLNLDEMLTNRELFKVAQKYPVKSKKPKKFDKEQHKSIDHK